MSISPVLSDRQAEGILKLLAKPEESIARVVESCEIGKGEVVRNVTVSLRTPDSDSGSSVPTESARTRWPVRKLPRGRAKAREMIYLDLVHPRRGQVAGVHLLDSTTAEVRSLSHEEHVLLAQSLIKYRFVNLFNTTELKLDPDDPLTNRTRLRFAGKMLLILEDLKQIPAKPPEIAREIFAKTFNKDNALQIFEEFPTAAVIPQKMSGLYRLCEELTERYLYVVECKVPDDSVGAFDVSYTYHHAIADQPPRSDQKSRMWALAVRRWLRDKIPTLFEDRHIVYASAPVAFQIHTPWARRTRHYELKVDAPAGYFLASQLVLVERGDDAPRPFRSAPGVYDCHINTGQGRRSHVFIGNGCDVPERLHVGLLNLELPGRSISRAATVAVLIFLLIAGFAILRAVLGSDAVAGMAALVVAIVAVGGFAFTPLEPNSILGLPLLARGVRTALSIVAVLFALWLFIPRWSEIQSPPIDPWPGVAEAWNFVEAWGAGALAFTCLVLVGWTAHRRRTLIRHFAEALDVRHISQ